MITQDTKLTNDLVNCDPVGVVIGAKGITLDLNGHTIDGVVSGPPTPFPPFFDPRVNAGVRNGGGPEERDGFDGVAVTNGLIRQFAAGVTSWNTNRTELHHLTVRDSRTGFELSGKIGPGVKHGGKDLRLHENRVVDSGLSLTGERLDADISNNRFTGGFFGASGLKGAEAVGNRFTRATVNIEGTDTKVRGNLFIRGGGFQCSRCSTVSFEGNTVRDNPVGGIFFFPSFTPGGTSHNRIVGNNVSDNGSTGMFIDLDDVDDPSDAPGRRNLVKNNVVARNDGVGIVVFNGRGTTVADNRLSRNRFGGITFMTPGTFGADNVGPSGQNVASGNDVTGPGTGIAVRQNDNNQIRDNRVIGRRDPDADGIVLEDSTRDAVSDNQILAYGNGVTLLNERKSRVVGNEVGDSRHDGIRLLSGGGSLVRRNEVDGRDRGDNGISVVSSLKNRLDRNSVTRQRQAGLASVFSADGNVIDRNVVTRTGGVVDGDRFAAIEIRGADDTRVTRNLVSRNDSHGLFVGTDSDIPDETSDGTEISSNRFSRNALDGSFVSDHARDTRVARNHLERNRDDGLDVEAPGTRVTRNASILNVDLGIEAVLGVIDGGRNVARDNGDARQCTNVRCVAQLERQNCLRARRRYATAKRRSARAQRRYRHARTTSGRRALRHARRQVRLTRSRVRSDCV